MPPRLSIIVVIYKMPRQAMNTLMSLSARLQKNVSESDYEIIAVENHSDSMLVKADVESLGSNIKYFSRPETGKSPAPAINDALEKASGKAIGLLIDGARMVTPRVVEYALMALTANPDALVCVPGYYLGPYEHNAPEAAHFSEQDEQQLLAKMQWTMNPYRLFDQCQISPANSKGNFQPFMESNCFFVSRKYMLAIGGADERFNLPGGGSINMYLLKRLGMLPDCSHVFILHGEGSFHQQHGGVSTSQDAGRKELLASFSQQLREISGTKHFRSFYREPIMLGSVTSHAMKFIQYSSQRGTIRFDRLSKKQEDFWPDDNDYDRYTEHFS